MTSNLSPSSNSKPKLEVRSWYLIGLVCLVMGLLILGEFFTISSPVSGEIRSNANQRDTVTQSDRFQTIGSITPQPSEAAGASSPAAIPRSKS